MPKSATALDCKLVSISRKIKNDGAEGNGIMYDKEWCQNQPHIWNALEVTSKNLRSRPTPLSEVS